MRFSDGFKLVVFILLSTAALAQKPSELAERLKRGSESSALDVKGITPWHLKMAVQLFDDKGKPTQDGTIEEWFLKPGTRRIVYDTPSYKVTELESEGRIYRTKDASTAPMMLEVLLDQAVHPMPAQIEIDHSTPRLIKTKLGKVPLECVMLDQPIKDEDPLPLGIFPTYCMDPGKDELRVSYEYGSQTTLRDAEATFQGKKLATVIGVKENSVQAASAHVVALGTVAMTPAQFAPSEDMEEGGAANTEVADGVMSQRLIYKTPMTMPESARQRGMQGSVLLETIIGRDGRVRSLRVLSSPDGDLAIAALLCVRQWRYTPYLVNGRAVQVVTKIIMRYGLYAGVG